MKIYKTGFAVWLGLLSLPGIVCAQTLSPASPQTVAVSTERLLRTDNVISRSIERQEFAGAIGFIARNGKIVYNKAFGYADAGTKTPLRTDHIFRIASQTKAVTSVAVMMLFEEGKLLLDDPLSKYIPAFAKPNVLDSFNAADSSYTTKPAKREITIRDLLTHTSGINYAVIGAPAFKAIYAKAGIPVGFEGGNITLRQAIDKLGRMPLTHQPGERFTYGLNSDVLGCLVEILSGKTLDQFFSERIFQPLGMKDTYFYLPADKQNRLVSIHTFGPDHKLVKQERSGAILADYPNRNGKYFSGGAGLSSTVADYAVFLQMLLNGGTYNGKRLLARRTVELMTMNQIGALSLGGDKFGLGFEITSKENAGKLGLSEGSYAWGGYFGTTYWVDPKEKIVAMIYIQQLPLQSDVHDKFRASVYQALID
jgi:CubicO group peptidase (beta-lactamase class C family)